MKGFDINLLSQIQALDKKLSMSQEHVNFRRKPVEGNKDRDSHDNARKFPNNSNQNHQRENILEDDENYGTIDITV